MSRRLGTYLYNQQKYGSDGYTSPLFGLLIDFENLGIFTGRNDGLRIQKFTVERGRRHWVKTDGSGFEEESTGKFSATVADPDELYNPYNDNSPLVSDLDVNRTLQLSVRTPDGNLYQLFTGTLTDMRLTDGVIPSVRFEASDGWDYLHSKIRDVSVELQQDITVSSAVQLVLNAVGWRYAYNAGTHTREIPYWWLEGGNAGSEISNLVFSELGSVYIKGDGSLNTEPLGYEATPIATLTDADIEDGSVELSTPWETRKNVFTLFASPKKLIGYGAIWKLRQTPILIPAGESYTYDVDPPLPYYVYTPVGGTDFFANTASNGSGTNLTASFVATVDQSGNGAKVTFKNNSGSGGYVLAGAVVKGLPIVWRSHEPILVGADNSVTFEVDFEFNGEKIPAVNLVTPEADVDFTANTLEDGDGTDLTSSFTVLVFPNGNKANVTVYNNSASNGYLIGAQIRGDAIYSSSKVTQSFTTIVGKEDPIAFEFDNPYYQTTGNMTPDILALVNNLATKKPSITFTLKPNPNLQFKIDLGSVLTLNLARFGTLTRRVAHIKHEFNQKSLITRTTIFCEPLRTGQIIDEGGVWL
jgi:hypothetical protein